MCGKSEDAEHFAKSEGNTPAPRRNKTSQASIAMREKAFIEDFSLLDDWMLQYEYLLYHIEDINNIPEDECTDALKVKGCVSNAWMRLSMRKDGSLFIELTSDALIIKGILGLITALIGRAAAREIAAWNPCLIERTALKFQLSVDRQKGIRSILDGIRNFARAQ